MFKLYGVLCIVLFLVNNSSEQSFDLQFDQVFDNDLYERVLDPELCQEHLQTMNSIEFYDSSFRVPSSIFEGNFVDYGNFFQCLSIVQKTAEHIIEGKHCMVTFPGDRDIIEIPWLPVDGNGMMMNVSWTEDNKLRHEQLIKYLSSKTDWEISRSGISDLLGNMRIGICIPKTCTVQEALGKYFNNSLLQVHYDVSHCRLPNDKPLVAVDYVAITIFGLISIITLASTCYEIRHIFILKNDPKDLHKIYSCCSVYTNTDRLLTFRSTPGALDCLDGIRALSILWVVIGHTLLLMTATPMMNLVSAFEWATGVQSLWLMSTNISVDTFFMLSGLLLVYTSVPKLSRVGLLKSLHLFYLNRILRLFPILATVVLLQATLFHHVDDGANWNLEGHLVQTCRNKWWQTMLYIQNYYSPPTGLDECLPHTWYLAVDMQLYIVSPLVLLLVLGSKRLAWTGLTIVILGTLTATTVYIFIVVVGQNSDYQSTYYVNTFTRAPPFLIGMMVGYLLHVYRGKTVKINQFFAYGAWAVALAIFALAIFAYHPMNQTETPSDVYRSLFYSFNRSVWAIALGWLIFACVKGYGGPLNWFLSLTFFKFIARISYAIYLLHYPLQFIFASSVIAPIYFSINNIWLNYIRDLMTTIMVSMVICIIIDAPISTLQKLLLGSGPRKTQPKKDDDTIKNKNVPATNTEVNPDIKVIEEKL